MCYLLVQVLVEYDLAHVNSEVSTNTPAKDFLGSARIQPTLYVHDAPPAVLRDSARTSFLTNSVG